MVAFRNLFVGVSSILTWRLMNYTKSILKKEKRIIEIARALKGKKQTGRTFHTTFVFNKRKLIVIGINDYTRLHPFYKYGIYHPTHPGSLHYKPSVHSEIDALDKLSDISTENYELWNVHIRNDGSIGCSKPCKNCLNVLKNKKFKRIFYHDSTGQLQIL